MWDSRRETLNGGERVLLLSEGATLSFAGALEAMRCDAGFREFLLGELRSTPAPAIFWETPPVTLALAGRPFEYVTIAAPGLDQAVAEPRAFADQLARTPAGENVAAFRNLGGDAILIAPRRLGAANSYTHLAAFLRSAPMSQQHDLLALTASQVQQALCDRPLWLSTCGTGVSWLHVRLDGRPKYYSHAPYRQWSGPSDRAAPV